MSAPLRERLRRSELVRGEGALAAFLSTCRLDGAARARVLLVADVRGRRLVVHVLDRATVAHDARLDGLAADDLATLARAPMTGRVRAFVLGDTGLQPGEVSEARSIINAPGGVS